jgi:hypothetical protein
MISWVSKLSLGRLVISTFAVGLLLQPAIAHEGHKEKKASPDKGVLEDARDLIGLIRDVRGLLKSNKLVIVTVDPVEGGAKKLPFDPADVREVIGLIREVQELVEGAPKSNKRVLVPDLGDLILTTAPIYEFVKSSPDFQDQKFGIAEVAATVALVREIRELTKSEKTTVEKIGIAEVAAAVAIAREVRDLLKAVPIDEEKGIRIGIGVEIKSEAFLEMKSNEAISLTDDHSRSKVRATEIFAELKRRESNAISGRSNKLSLLADFATLDRKTLFHDHGFPTGTPPFIDAAVPSLIKNADSLQLFNWLEADRKRVYDRDDRLDIRDWIRFREDAAASGRSTIKHDGYIANANRVCCIVKRSQVHKIPGEDAYQVDVGKFSVCPEERFSRQPVMSFCSGFLVTKDIVVTAGHCVESSDDAMDQVYVFGFQLPVNGNLFNDESFIAPADDVYFASALLGRKLDEETKSDFAVVRLDRNVAGRTPVTIHSGRVEKDASVYTIGHPCGLPMKVADNAIVGDSSNSVYFTTNLDTYGGNSGSGVWLADSHELVGILVRGGQDFQYVSLSSKNTGELCRSTVYVGGSNGRGEDVTRVSEFLSLIEPHLE